MARIRIRTVALRAGLLALTACRSRLDPSVTPARCQQSVQTGGGRSLSVALPLPAGALSPITDTFDAARPGGRVHEALDLFAARGTLITPIFPGRIVGIGWNTLGGRTLSVFNEEHRLVRYYAHLDTYAPGRTLHEWVAFGDPLGTVGTSGNAERTPPHLHLQVRRVMQVDQWRGGTPVRLASVLVTARTCARRSLGLDENGTTRDQ